MEIGDQWSSYLHIANLLPPKGYAPFLDEQARTSILQSSLET